MLPRKSTTSLRGQLSTENWHGLVNQARTENLLKVAAKTKPNQAETETETEIENLGYEMPGRRTNTCMKVGMSFGARVLPVKCFYFYHHYEMENTTYSPRPNPSRFWSSPTPNGPHLLTRTSSSSSYTPLWLHLHVKQADKFRHANAINFCEAPMRSTVPAVTQ